MNDQDSLSRRRYSTILIVIGVLVLLYPLLTEVYGAYIQRRMRADWRAEVKKQEEQASKAERRQAALIGRRTVINEDAVLREVLSDAGPGSGGKERFPRAKIKIPKIGLEQIVVNGTDTKALKNGPGHYPGTPNPGEKGNVAIAGHRVTYTRPFNRVDELTAGDEIIIETIKYIYTYKVSFSRILDPNDITMLKPTTGARLTLTTCAPKYSADKRLDVRAELVRAVPRQKPTILKRLIAKLTEPPPEETPKTAVDLAMKEARRDLQRDPKDFLAHVRLGVAYQARNKNKKARAEYEQASRLNRRSSLPYYQLALLAEKEGKMKEAIERLRRATAVNPGDERAQYRLGRLLLKTGKYQEAVSIFQADVKKLPFSADTHYYLGLAYEKSGNTAAAVNEYEAALKYVPNYKEAKEGLKRTLYND